MRYTVSQLSRLQAVHCLSCICKVLPKHELEGKGGGGLGERIREDYAKVSPSVCKAFENSPNPGDVSVRV